MAGPQGYCPTRLDPRNSEEKRLLDAMLLAVPMDEKSVMLTQSEADALIAMRKVFVNPDTISLSPGTDETHDVVGDDKREQFMLDLWRGTIRLSKIKYQTRGRRVIVLVRLDIDGAPHTNPDGAQLIGTHLHLYREGYEAKWAFSVDTAA